MRYILSIFCIAFGTFSIVMLLALGDGFHHASMKNLHGVTEGSYYIWLDKSEKSHAGYSKGRENKITIDDVLELPHFIPEIEHISTGSSNQATLSYQGKTYSKDITGVLPDYFYITKSELSKDKDSRFINLADDKSRAHVAIIGYNIKKIFFGNNNDDNVIGKTFLIDNVKYIVIGVLCKEDSYREDEIFIPYHSYQVLYGNENDLGYFIVKPKLGTNNKKFVQALRCYFSHKYHFDKNDLGAMGLWSSTKIFLFMHWFFIGIQFFLGFCGFMILVVGGIGVANIMFLTVAERTYEIGLRKAVGATNKQILVQLLKETMIIVGAGGALGILMALIAVFILQHITLPSWLGNPTLSWITMAVAIFILGLVGIVTGYFPAKRAALMDPVEALLK